jgi:hypothetical protein
VEGTDFEERSCGRGGTSKVGGRGHLVVGKEDFKVREERGQILWWGGTDLVVEEEDLEVREEGGNGKRRWRRPYQGKVGSK